MATAPAVITCPACKKRFKGKPELAGKKIKCPGCNEPFVVPAAEEAITAAAPEPAPVAGKPFEPPPPEAYGVGAVDLAARCPNCAGLMENETAIICLHCGYNTLTREHGKTKKLIAASPMEHFIYLLPSLAAATTFGLIIIFILWFNLVVPELVVGNTKAEWLAHESIRMWSAMGLVAVMWTLGVYAFNTIAMKPKPPEAEKEDNK